MTPVQEIAFASATRSPSTRSGRGEVSEADFPKVFGRISFFVNAGVRFIEEHCALMGEMWEWIGAEPLCVTHPSCCGRRSASAAASGR